MKKMIPVLLVLIGVAGGLGAGVFLKPQPDGAEVSETTAPSEATESDMSRENGGAPANRAFVKVGRQTIIPVLEDGQTRALMMFELAVDVPAARANVVHEMEPRLRDAFLRELFQMSYTGAFLTNFTDDRVIEELRRNLTRAARQQIGDDAREVLILDVMRQEL